MVIQNQIFKPLGIIIFHNKNHNAVKKIRQILNFSIKNFLKFEIIL